MICRYIKKDTSEIIEAADINYLIENRAKALQWLGGPYLYNNYGMLQIYSKNGNLLFRKPYNGSSDLFLVKFNTDLLELYDFNDFNNAFELSKLVNIENDTPTLCCKCTSIKNVRCDVSMSENTVCGLGINLAKFPDSMRGGSIVSVIMSKEI